MDSNDYRKTDATPYKAFRTSRFFKHEGSWYFSTREGTSEGPYHSREEAEAQLEKYIQVVNSGFYNREVALQLEPKSGN